MLGNCFGSKEVIMLGQDWIHHYSSVTELENDLGNFNYQGPGWYLENKNTLLIFADGGEIKVYCWNRRLDNPVSVAISDLVDLIQQVVSASIIRRIPVGTGD